MKNCKHCRQAKHENEFKTKYKCLECHREKQREKFKRKIERRKLLIKTPITKECSKCHISQHISAFYVGTSVCQNCSRKYSKDYRQKNQEAIKARTRIYRKKMTPLDRYISRIRNQYGVSIEWYNEQLEKQNGRCAICNQLPTARKDGLQKLYIDHNHKTNQVRELLCQHCNTLIGCALENPLILEKSIDYLRKHNQLPLNDDTKDTLCESG